LDILKENWSAVYNVQTILLSIQSLLGEPNPDSPLNAHAATLWANQVRKFSLRTSIPCLSSGLSQEEYKKVLLKKYVDDTKSTAATK